ncbi:hypothetical protein RUM44_010278 [Polyplax serrata]|uniref:ABC-type uncharacterized transport system domain-containing protein n=1 Tax=Polyplax serrata TaxID=468196 RepID=A0ABR1AV24_POLSC
MLNKDNVLFDQSKKENFKLNNHYKTIHRRLKEDWNVVVNKEEISSSILKGVKLIIFTGPNDNFTENEIHCLKTYIEEGGSVLVTLGEGGEKLFQTNINFLLEEFGIMVNNDCVLRTHYYKYFHPKESFISNGVLNRAVLKSAKKYKVEEDSEDAEKLLTFVYPFGATLNVVKPAIAVLSSGSVSIPLQRPVCAFYKKQGKLVVIGSSLMLADSYIDKEDNSDVMKVIFSFLLGNDIQLNQIDADDPDIADYSFVPSLSELVNKPKVCLQQPTMDLQLHTITGPKDKLFSVNLDNVPIAIEGYEVLGLKHEPLKLITPEFETPLPALQPAVFPPVLRELPPPPLELFDLEEAFSSEKMRLARVANKCLPEKNDQKYDEEFNLNFFIQECAQIVRPTSKVSQYSNPRQILYELAVELFHLKKSSADFK